MKKTAAMISFILFLIMINARFVFGANEGGVRLVILPPGVSGSGEPGGSGGGGGGGGGGGASSECRPRWVCEDWNVCQNAELSFSNGALPQADYNEIAAACAAEKFGECGWQTRSCVDANNCGSVFGFPPVTQSCYFTENPSCTDNIKNCHDGACEQLVDCGGTCEACLTCSDGIKNQGEDGVDCGGPCPYECAQSFTEKLSLNYLWVVVIILLIIFGWRVYLYIKLRRIAKRAVK